MNPYLLLTLVSIHAAAVTLCVVILYFMAKPFRATGDTKYLGLPLGFGFLGLSHVLSASTFFTPLPYLSVVAYLQLFARSFAFTFLAITYYFSGSTSEKSRIARNITLSILIVASTLAFIIIVASPWLAFSTFQVAEVYTRVFNVACLVYMAVYTLRSHVRKPDPTTIWIPQSYILLAVSQFLLFVWGIDHSYAAFGGAMALLLLGLTVFVIVSYQAFCCTDRKVGHDAQEKP